LFLKLIQKSLLSLKIKRLSNHQLPQKDTKILKGKKNFSLNLFSSEQKGTLPKSAGYPQPSPCG
jgi:hypothetical protein